jgi:diguanylate cyclase (GGDEF)-like protein
MLVLGLLPSFGLLFVGVMLWSSDGEALASLERNENLFEQQNRVLQLTASISAADATMYAASLHPDNEQLRELAETERRHAQLNIDDAVANLGPIVDGIAELLDQDPEQLRALVGTSFVNAQQSLQAQEAGEPLSAGWLLSVSVLPSSLRAGWNATDAGALTDASEFQWDNYRALGDYTIAVSSERSALLATPAEQMDPTVAASNRAAVFENFANVAEVFGYVGLSSTFLDGTGEDPARAIAAGLADTSDIDVWAGFLAQSVELSNRSLIDSQASADELTAQFESELVRLQLRRAGGVAIAAVMAALSLLLVAITWSEIRHRRRVERAHADAIDELDTKARRDPMTGLWNRRQAEERLADALIRQDIDGHVMLAYLDLDRFKALNDVWGHAVGDQILGIVAARLGNANDQAFEVIRFGGDEFVAYANIPDATLERATELANRMIDRIAQPILISGKTYEISATVGVTVSVPESTPESLLLEADSSLILAKQTTRGSANGYDRSLNRSTQLVRELPAALESGDITAHFQPVFDVANGELSHFEALARWQRPDGTYVSPGEFVPLLESFGLASGLTEAIVDQIGTLLNLPTLPEHIDVFMNVSPRELEISTFATRILELIETRGIDPTRVGIEITETAAISDPLMLGAHLRTLREAGMQVAIDDFGSGYSPLGLLFDLPIDIVKIDRSMISNVDQDSARAAIVGGIIRGLREHGIAIVAEGVEREAELEWLRGADVDLVQGFLTGRPTPRLELDQFLDRSHA